MYIDTCCSPVGEGNRTLQLVCFTFDASLGCIYYQTGDKGSVDVRWQRPCELRLITRFVELDNENPVDLSSTV